MKKNLRAREKEKEKDADVWPSVLGRPSTLLPAPPSLDGHAAGTEKEEQIRDLREYRGPV